MHKKREKETLKERKEVNGRKQERSGKCGIWVDALVKLEANQFINHINFDISPLIMENLLAFDKAKLFCNKFIHS